MKVIFKIIALFMVFLISENLFAQQVHISNIVKQQKVTTAANTNAKVHANSNSIFGSGNTPSKYDKKKQPKNNEVKDEEGMKKNNNAKKQKK